MLHFLQGEFSGLWQFLKRNRDAAVIIASATLFLTLDKYHPIGPEWLSSLLYYAVFPVLVILLILRKNPLDFGLRWGTPRVWGYYVLIFCLAAAAVLYASSFITFLRSYYLAADFNIAVYILTQIVTLASWEFLYRGFLLFGLKEKLGELSIIVQMVPFVLLHLGKPELETLSTVITGLLFGYVAYRGRSYWPAFFIHLFINVFFVVLVNLKYPAGA